jgi:hypothetical protein
MVVAVYIPVVEHSASITWPNESRFPDFFDGKGVQIKPSLFCRPVAVAKRRPDTQGRATRRPNRRQIGVGAVRMWRWSRAAVCSRTGVGKAASRVRRLHHQPDRQRAWHFSPAGAIRRRLCLAWVTAGGLSGCGKLNPAGVQPSHLAGPEGVEPQRTPIPTRSRRVYPGEPAARLLHRIRCRSPRVSSRPVPLDIRPP